MLNLKANVPFATTVLETYLSLIIERFLLVPEQATFYRSRRTVGCVVSCF
jgi:hypothetical protein